jgi:hypothetical protein
MDLFSPELFSFLDTRRLGDEIWERGVAFLTFSSFVVSEGWSGLMAYGSAPSPFQQRHRGDTQAIDGYELIDGECAS